MRREEPTYRGQTMQRGSYAEGFETHPSRFPPYVYSTSANGALIHRVKRVAFRWYDYRWDHMVRQVHPTILVETFCNHSFRIGNYRRGKGRMCFLPSSASIHCKACNDQGYNFPRSDETSTIRKRIAKAQLGCVVGGSRI